MQRWIAVWFGSMVLAGCAGLDIRPLTREQAANAHAGAGPAGYIVYGPMTVIEVSDKGGCHAGAPFQLPDYSKPYLVRSRTGLGRNGIDVAIDSGWMLSGIKDTSDSSALLDSMGTVFGVRGGPGAAGPGGGSGTAAGACRAPGLYRLAPGAAGNIELLPLQLY
jgi:hypothetical protein